MKNWPQSPLYGREISLTLSNSSYPAQHLEVHPAMVGDAGDASPLWVSLHPLVRGGGRLGEDGTASTLRVTSFLGFTTFIHQNIADLLKVP